MSAYVAKSIKVTCYRETLKKHFELILSLLHSCFSELSSWCSSAQNNCGMFQRDHLLKRCVYTAASLKAFMLNMTVLVSVLHTAALKEGKTDSLCKPAQCRERARGGGGDYYSKPLNEFKNSDFAAFAIQSLCLGLMQKMPFAFLLWAELRALMHTRITIAANLCDISLHYHSWSPVKPLNACDLSDKLAEQHMHCASCIVPKKQREHCIEQRGARFEAVHIPPTVQHFPLRL